MCVWGCPTSLPNSWKRRRPGIRNAIPSHVSHAGTKEGACMVVGSHLSVCTIFECLVVLFQLCWIMGLCLNRLMPRSTSWSSRGQVGLIVALFGLGIAGALCGRHDSEF